MTTPIPSHIKQELEKLAFEDNAYTEIYLTTGDGVREKVQIHLTSALIKGGELLWSLLPKPSEEQDKIDSSFYAQNIIDKLDGGPISKTMEYHWSRTGFLAGRTSCPCRIKGDDNGAD